MTVSITATINEKEKQFPMTFSAFSFSFAPKKIDAFGAPPLPANIANALIIIRIGVNKPTPVNAAAPIPGI